MFIPGFPLDSYFDLSFPYAPLVDGLFLHTEPAHIFGGVCSLMIGSSETSESEENRSERPFFESPRF